MTQVDPWTGGEHSVGPGAEHRALLDVHPLIAPLRGDERTVLLAHVEVFHVPAGTTLIAEGDETTPLLLVLRGTARVARGGRELALVGAGSWVGELALLDGRPARTDVVAVSDMHVGLVDPDAARRVLDLDPVALQLDSLARRRRAANEATAVDPVPVTLRDGGTVQLRPLVAADWQEFAEADGEGRVSPRSLEMRFFVQPPRTERSFRQLTDIDLRNEFAWAAIVDGRIIGVGRYALQAEDRGAAELAVLVADEHQRRGIGRLLVDAVIVTAATHGADELIAIARADNEPILRLLTEYGAAFEPTTADEGAVRGRWPIAAALAAVRDRRLRTAVTAAAWTVLRPVLDD